MTNTICITGATGFIGRAVVEELARAGYELICVSRKPGIVSEDPRVRWAEIADYSDTARLSDALRGASIVIHLADDPNRDTQQNGDTGAQMSAGLLEAMQTAGVGKLILASSIYARLQEEGEASAYGARKLSVERVFLSAPDIRSIVLRLPPVYGPGGGGGMGLLAKLIRRGLPLPVGMAHAKRSYLARANLTNLVLCLVQMPDENWPVAKENLICEPSDGQPVPTRDLALVMSEVMGVRARIVAVPPVLMKTLGRLTGKSEAIAAAFSPLEARGVPDLRAISGWKPLYNIPESLDFLA